MKKYRMFHAPYMSFYSGDFYRDVAESWRGVAYLYLFLLLAVLWIIQVSGWQGQLADWIEQKAPLIVDQIPAITIEYGEVNVDVPTPHYIRDPETNEVWATIDTSGQISSLHDVDGKILLTRYRFAFRRDNGEVRSFPLDDLDIGTIDRHRFYDLLDSGSSWFSAVTYPVGLFASFVFRIFQTLFYGLIGLIIAAFLGANLKFDASVRLAVMAITPVLILDTLRSVGDIAVPRLNMLGVVLALSYLFFGIYMKHQAEKEAAVEVE